MVVIPSPPPLPFLPILCRIEKIDLHFYCGPANQWFNQKHRTWFGSKFLLQPYSSGSLFWWN